MQKSHQFIGEVASLQDANHFQAVIDQEYCVVLKVEQNSRNTYSLFVSHSYRKLDVAVYSAFLRGWLRGRNK
jgi:hypothetical protein